MSEATLSNLYGTVNQFFLDVNGTTTEIREPIGFADAEIVLRRNLKNDSGIWEHGVNWEFTSETVNLSYDNSKIDNSTSSARELIEAALLERGVNSEIYLVFGNNEGSFTEFFRAKLLLEETISNIDFISVPAKRVFFNDKLKSRLDIEVDITRNTDLEGNSITSLTPSKLSLHSQEILRVLQANSEIDENDNVFTFQDEIPTSGQGSENTYGDFSTGFISLGFENKINQTLQTDLEERTTLTTGLDSISTDAGNSRNIENQVPYFFEAQEAGNYTLVLDGDIDLNLTLVDANQSVESFYRYRAAIEILKASDNSEETIEIIKNTSNSNVQGRSGLNTAYINSVNQFVNNAVTVGTNCTFLNGSTTLNTTIALDTTKEITLEVGDKVRVWFYFEYTSPNNTEFQIEEVTGTITVKKELEITLTGITRTDGTIVDSFTAKECFEKLTEIYLGSNKFVSDYFDTGQGQLVRVLNGKMIRGFTASESPPKISFAKLLKSLSTERCLGISFEKNVSEEDVIRVEPIEYFYKEVEILDLGAVGSYQESYNQELIFNEIEIGYSKQAASEVEASQGLNDFHTLKKYTTPITSIKNKLELGSDYLWSGVAIEETRRIQKIQDATKDTKFDEDVFLIYESQNTTIDNVSFLAIKKTTDAVNGVLNGGGILLNESFFYDYQEATQVTISGTGNAELDKTHTIIDVALTSGLAGFTFSAFTSNITADTVEEGSFQFEFNSNTLAYSEKNEAFESVTGVVSPTTTYNLRTQPMRVLHNWHNLINASITDFYLNDKVRFVSGEGNREVSTKFKNSEQYKAGDIDNQTLTDNSDYEISQIAQGRSLFSALQCRCEVKISYNNLYYLRRAFENRSGDSNNNGYVTIRDFNGNFITVYITSINYVPKSDMIVTLEGLIKDRFSKETGVITGSFDNKDFNNDFDIQD